MRVCSEPGCPTICAGPRCEDHTPTTLQRGYDAQHKRLKRRMQVIVDRGQAMCARAATNECLMPSPVIIPGSEWALDHDADRTGYLGATHKLCNDAAGGRATADGWGRSPARRRGA